MKDKVMNYWLFKSEPSTFSIEDLVNCKGKREHWDGVRNYQARNFMKTMNKGDLGFFYHSSCKTPAIVGIVQIVKEHYPDHTSWDKKSSYYDPKSSLENPRWFMVDVQFVRKLKANLNLEELKKHPKISDLSLLKKGNRLSIIPVSQTQWKYILSLE